MKKFEELFSSYQRTKLEKLCKKNPNDQELGALIRKLFQWT